jgi:hypothetical protein
MRKSFLIAALIALPQAAFAWGGVGHRTIGELAVRSFPAELPAFLRGPQSAAEMGILSQEPDTSRNAGQPHDYDLDPGHFVDVSDDLTILGGPRLSALPASRRDYDTALRAVGAEQYKAGFLPYNILDGYQQLVKDFARHPGVGEECREIQARRRRSPRPGAASGRAQNAHPARPRHLGAFRGRCQPAHACQHPL